MTRRKGVGGLKRLATLGAVALLPLVLFGGCPIAVPLTISASANPLDATVDKPVSLDVTIAGGTAPYTTSWVQTKGPIGAIADATAVSTTGTPGAAGFYTYQVTVTDSGAPAQTLSASVDFAAADIQFVVTPDDAQPTPAGSLVIKGGNPATIQFQNPISSSGRANNLQFRARARVFDPTLPDLRENDLVTPFTVTYDLISVPSGGSTSDVALDRAFDTMSNQGTGESNVVSGSNPTLDAVLGVTITANANTTFNTLSNLATLIQNFGQVVPGDYVLRATVTNPSGVQRWRDLTVNVVTEGVNGTFGGRSAGPGTVAVKTLPNGLTDNVMTANQTASMTVTVYPSTTTTYRFFLREAFGNVDIEVGQAAAGAPAGFGLAHPEHVSPSTTADVTASGPTDIALSIGNTAGITPGTYTLRVESFDGLANVVESGVSVNGPAGGGTPVRFHVTNDFLSSSSINAVDVGVTSTTVGAEVTHKGWNSVTALGFGSTTVSADVNLDGHADIISFAGTNVNFNTAGFTRGSTAAFRHPTNAGNLGAAALGVLAAPVAANGTIVSLAVGDLNGDSLPDIAVGLTGGAGPTASRVQVFFHTGNPAAPYSSNAANDQTLEIRPPVYDRQQDDTSTANIIDNTAVIAYPGTLLTSFGAQVAIADQTGDGQADLIVTDQGFTRVVVSKVAAPTPPAVVPPASDTLFEGLQGRVYVFAGGSADLAPGRPDMITSFVKEFQLTDGAAPPVLSTSFTESNVKYALAYDGNTRDAIGATLATGGSLAVGNAAAPGNGSFGGFVTIGLPTFGNDLVTDGDTVAVTATGIGTRTYEFDTTAGGGVAGVVAGNIAVNLAADNTAANARAQLIVIMNGDAADQKFVSASQNDAISNRVDLVYLFGAIDHIVNARATTVAVVAAAGNITASGAFTQNLDGVVYRVATAAATGTLANPITGTTDSSMGLGSRLALGNINGAGSNDDLLIAALDSGADAGVNGDGAVFMLLDGSTDFAGAATKIDVGIDSLGSGTVVAPGGSQAGGADFAPAGVGLAIGLGDINGDGLDESFLTEPGFDRIYIVNGAASPSATPSVTFFGVRFQTDLAGAGNFVVGDYTGDGFTDWVYSDGGLQFGLTGVGR